MKKIIILLVLLVLLGAGGYYFLRMQAKPSLDKLAEKGNAQGGSVFTSIKDALSKSVSLECDYTSSETGKVKVYIKGGAIRSTSETKDKEQPNNFIMKDNKLYMWNDASKTGIMTSWETPKNVTSSPTVKTEKEEPEDKSEANSLLGEIEKYKNACKPAVVSDSLFTVPKDVKFTDMSALQNKMLEEISKAPQGGSVSEDELKKLMEQYSGASQ